MSSQEGLLYLNGLDAETGGPLIDPVSYEALSERVLEVYRPKERVKDAEEFRAAQTSYSLYDEYELDDPQQAGWGLLVHADEADEMQKVLKDLIDHRNGRILLYQGEDPREWKEQNHANDVNPDKFPFYVLIAGSPSRIPFELQFSLDILQSVGRIDFESPDDYARYAKTVVDHETGQAPAPGKRAVFFAPRHDYPTSQSESRMVRPLLKQLPQVNGVPDGIVYETLKQNQATKENLLAALQPDDAKKTPALLFSASHGVGVRKTDDNQRTLQGSIVCQDFEFPLTPEARTGFVSGYDVAEGFSLPGGIHFFFACFGAGSRARSDFARYLPTDEGRERLIRTEAKETDFVAYLPTQLLANPQGGALAVVGHVDPAWIHSLQSPVTKGRRIFPFGLALARLLRSKPVGYAVTAFNQKYSDLSTDLLSVIEDLEENDISPDPEDLGDLWICRNDAQNYAIIGDPAVHLRFG
jgi:hypothetical protein